MLLKHWKKYLWSLRSIILYVIVSEDENVTPTPKSDVNSESDEKSVSIKSSSSVPKGENCKFGVQFICSNNSDGTSYDLVLSCKNRLTTSIFNLGLQTSLVFQNL